MIWPTLPRRSPWPHRLDSAVLWVAIAIVIACLIVASVSVRKSASVYYDRDGKIICCR